MRSLYTKQSRFYQWFFIEVLGWGKQLEAFFHNSNYLSPNLKILDAGCGTGIVTRILYSIAEQQVRDIQFHAFDLTPAMLEVFCEWIAEKGIKNIELTQANVLLLEEQLPSHWREYDLVISATMLEYIQKPKVTEAVSNLKHLLKSKGTLLVFVTRRNFLTRWLAQGWWKANVYEEKEIEQIFHLWKQRMLVLLNATAPKPKTMPLTIEISGNKSAASTLEMVKCYIRQRDSR